MYLIIPIVQAIAGALWLVEAAVLLPGSLRVWRGTGDAIDAGRIPLFMLGFILPGFSLRWLIWPHALATMNVAELSFWAALYLAEAGTAVFCIAAHRAFNRALR